MRVDLHNHTPLCNHATGRPREYIIKAIEEGIDIYGFSDHAPMDFDKKYRMSFDAMKSYEDEILSLKNEFQDRVDIRLGYEVDYIKGHMFEKVLSAKVDYLIGSVHFLDNWGFDNPEYIKGYEGRDIDTIWQEYFNAVEQMAKMGRFNIVGHIDLMKVFNFLPKKDIRLIAKNAIKAIKEAGMSVEINAAGYRKPVKEQYPSKYILEVCYEANIPITFGSDAHSIEQVGLNYTRALEFAKSIGYSNCVSYINKEIQLHKI